MRGSPEYSELIVVGEEIKATDIAVKNAQTALNNFDKNNRVLEDTKTTLQSLQSFRSPITTLPKSVKMDTQTPVSTMFVGVGESELIDDRGASMVQEEDSAHV